MTDDKPTSDDVRAADAIAEYDESASERESAGDITRRLAGAKKYGERLSRHVLALSNEQRDFCVAAREWDLLEIEELGAPRGECPCGKKNILYLAHLRNRVTRSETNVGTECLKLFGPKLRLVSRALSALAAGIHARYACDDKYGRHQFKVSRALLVARPKTREVLAQYYGSVPIYDGRDGACLMCVQRTGRSFVRDGVYTLDIRARHSLPVAPRKSLVLVVRAVS